MKKSLADEALELVNAATPGPWNYTYDGSGDYSIGPSDPQSESRTCHIWATHNERENARENAALIAAAPTLIAELARRLKKAIEMLRECDCDFDCVFTKQTDTRCPEHTEIDELEKPLEGPG